MSPSDTELTSYKPRSVGGGGVSRGRLLLAVGVVFYLAVLYLSYRFVIAPGVGGFSSYIYSPPPTKYLLGALVIAAVPVLWMPISVQRPTQALYWFLYLTVYIPSCLVPLVVLDTPAAEVVMLPLGLFVSFAVMGTAYRLPLLTFRSIPTRPVLFWSLVLLCVVVANVWLVRIFGFDLRLPSWFDVYDVRAEYKGRLSGYPLASIVVRWLMYVVNPLLIGWGIVRRQLAFICIGVLGLVFVYAITGFKTALMLPVLIGGMIVLFRRGGNRFGLELIWLTTGAISIALLTDLLLGSGVFSYALTRRVVIVPGLLTGYYFEYFSQYGFVKLQHMGIGRALFFASDQYSLTQPYLIASTYFGNPEASANANVWADGYSNFGFVGMISFSFILSALFYLYDSVAASKNYWLTRVLLVGPVITLANSALVSVLVGHGFLVAVFLLFLVPVARGRTRAIGRGTLLQRFSSGGSPILIDASR